jgi:hypothetical protein
MKVKKWDIPVKFRYFKENNIVDILGKLPYLRKIIRIYIIRLDALSENIDQRNYEKPSEMFQ